MTTETKPNSVKVGQLVAIRCVHSKYNGERGEIFIIQETSQYAMVQLPKGTELRIERIKTNTILEALKNSSKPKPQGDPQWFPLHWLVGVERPVE